MHYVDTRTQKDQDEAQIRKAADLLSRFQCSKARKHLQSNGLGDHANPDIIEQMKRKHPLRKKTASLLSASELQVERKSPGLGCMRNEHLLALTLNPE